jgi:hypothetical protein
VRLGRDEEKADEEDFRGEKEREGEREEVAGVMKRRTIQREDGRGE